MKEYIKEYIKLLRFAKPFKGLLVIATIVMGISTLFDGVSLGMILPILDRILTNKKIIVPMHLPPMFSGVVDQLNALTQIQVLQLTTMFIVGLFLLKEIFAYTQGYLMNMIGQGVLREARNKLYSKFQALSMDFYADKRAGELISRVVNDVSLIVNAISYGLTDLIYQSMQTILYAIVALSLGFFISWKLAAVVFFVFPAIMIPVARVGRRIKKYMIEVQSKVADLNSHLSETIQGAYIVKVFNREEYEKERFEKINLHYYRYMLKSIKRTLILPSITELVGAIGVTMILVIAGKEVIGGKVSAGTFVLFLGSLMSAIRPIKKLTNVHAINQQAFAASKRIYDILDEEVKIQDKPQALEVKEFKESIKFENIYFRYKKERSVLEDINLNVKKGQVIALVGHSGAGKSTLVSLLPRLYDPYKGRVLIDGVDIRDFKVKDLRALISVVSQEMVLFHSTVKNNIAYGREGATDEEIIDAANKAHAYEFVQKMPHGFATIIGDRGIKISGGERQRLAIARALLKNSPILILDEATSQLDSQSEHLVQEAFYNLMKGRTVFAIAHRLSTVQQADKILVMENGRIVEAGSHAELMSRDSLYKKLYSMQFHS